MFLKYCGQLVAFGVLATTFLDGYAQVPTGIEPEVQALLISEEDMQAQMALKNNGDDPLLLHTTIHNVPDDNGVYLITLSPVARIEAKGRQIIRFVLEKLPEPLTVQHYKRVTFEGVPTKRPDATGSQVRLSIRYDLPVIISPAKLKQIDAPWELLEWTLKEHQLVFHNPSAYVVRMSSHVDLMPGSIKLPLGKRTYVLPGETTAVNIPASIDIDSLTKVRLYPATLYGFAAPDYDAPLKR